MVGAAVFHGRPRALLEATQSFQGARRVFVSRDAALGRSLVSHWLENKGGATNSHLGLHPAPAADAPASMAPATPDPAARPVAGRGPTRRRPCHHDLGLLDRAFERVRKAVVERHRAYRCWARAQAKSGDSRPEQNFARQGAAVDRVHRTFLPRAAGAPYRVFLKRTGLTRLPMGTRIVLAACAYPNYRDDLGEIMRIARRVYLCPCHGGLCRTAGAAAGLA